MFAQIIVDIRHEEVNHLFDYVVPLAMEPFLSRGMRVMVPFGSQIRMGFVMFLKDSSDTATKEILEVLDAVPTLSEEMFAIVDHLVDTAPSLLSSIFKTLIPSEILMDYQKVAHIVNQNMLPEDLMGRFNRKGIWKLKQHDQVLYPRLKRLEKQGVLSIQTEIKEKQGIKTERVYRFNFDHAYPRIDQYIGLTEKFTSSEAITRASLLDEGFTPSMIQTLIRHQVLLPQKQEVIREIHHVFELKDKDIRLTSEQQRAAETIMKSLSTPDVFLLHGVTGSGKTEVYVSVMEKVIASGKQVLFLVPEITLIGPMALRLKSRFDAVSIYHSGLSKGERLDQYRMVRDQKASILLGTRSAVFLPLERLGLIVIDEEHDASYLQTEGVIYHARDIAILKSKYHQAPVVLGSATPSVESMYHAQQNSYHLIELSKRHHDISMPHITFVDMKQELKEKNTSIFSRKLMHEMEERLKKKEQTLILFNRKGYAPFVLCRGCGHVPMCPRCEISLTYYKDKQTLKCHYCGYEKPYEATCESCKEPKVKEMGVGIEYVTEKLKAALPQARIERMDQNVTRTKGSHESIWHRFLSEESDILVGTEMIAKGLDFPKVTLVGVLMADMMLRVPSYAASEKTYMLLSQVTGRSGRFLPGEAIIQGYDLSHYAITSLLEGYDAFYKNALYARKLAQDPPFSNHAQILIEGASYLKTYQTAFAIRKKTEALQLNPIGPAPAIIKKLRDRHRFTVTLKYHVIHRPQLFDMLKSMETDDIKITYYPTLDIV